MQEFRLWKTGDACTVTAEGRSVPGKILLASGNGLSLFVEFEAILHGHVGQAPLSWEPRLGEFVSIATGREFVLSERKALE